MIDEIEESIEKVVVVEMVDAAKDIEIAGEVVTGGMVSIVETTESDVVIEIVVERGGIGESVLVESIDLTVENSPFIDKRNKNDVSFSP